MKINENTNVIMFLTDELLLKHKFTFKGLIGIISRDDFPCNDVICQLNKMIEDELNTLETIEKYNKIFVDNIGNIEKVFGNIKIDRTLLSNKKYSIISSVGCEILLSLILKYGKFKEKDLSYKKEFLLTLIVIATSVFSDDKKNSKERLLVMLNQMQYYQLSNIEYKSSIARANYIYYKYVNNNLKFQNLFIKKYNYSIYSYLCLLNFIVILKGTNGNYIDIDVLKLLIDEKEVAYLIKDIKLDLNDSKILNEIDVQFQIYPEVLNEKFILEVNNSRIQIINYNRLVGNMYLNFINKIRMTYSSGKEFSREYGDLIEKYCSNLAKEYTANAKNKYHKYINKFKYDNGKESSDFYIKINDDLLVFEIKSTGRYQETIKTPIDKNTNSWFEEEIKRKAVLPVEQIEKSITDIKKCSDIGKEIDEIKNAKNMYYIIVSEEVIKNNKKLYIEQISNIKCNNTSNQPIYLDLTEFESLLASLMNRSKTVISTIEHYLKNYRNSNFIDFVLRENTSFKFHKNRLIDKVRMFDDIIEKLENKRKELDERT